MTPRYPIYIISKGRWKLRLTSKALEKMGTPYKIVVEPQEYEQYAAVIDPKKILQLPFSNLGQGSIPARNWVWEHALASGAKRHWILDDNIGYFERAYGTQRIRVHNSAIFCAAEDFVDRYKNIALAGMQYHMFVIGMFRLKNPRPFVLNTRIYSCILIDNSLQFRWRGRYNEDTDLSLRVLKAGYCTVLFYAFSCDKINTMKMKGGNTEDLYKIEDGRLKMAKSLQVQHPDCVTITQRWGRFQHMVDYSKFKENRLIKISSTGRKNGVNNYGMVLKNPKTGDVVK